MTKGPVIGCIIALELDDYPINRCWFNDTACSHDLLITPNFSSEYELWVGFTRVNGLKYIVFRIDGKLKQFAFFHAGQ